MKKILDQILEFNFIDIGCSGSLPSKWKPLLDLINVVGFDPNKEECKNVIEISKHKYKSINIYPFAIFDSSDEKTLYKTKSKYCYSLFQPNSEIVSQFHLYKDMFKLLDTEIVQTKALNECQEIKDFDLDILKIDSQGAEIPVLSKSTKFLRDAIHVEIEAGFIESYKGQRNSFGEIEKIMKKEHFILFDINTSHRIPRNNKFHTNYQDEQLIYSETTWIKDYVSLHDEGILDSYNLTKQKALKAITICNLQGCLSYGLELAKIFREKDIISENEFEYLNDSKNWNLRSKQSSWRVLSKRLIYQLLKMAPCSLRHALRNELKVLEHEPIYKNK